MFLVTNENMGLCLYIQNGIAIQLESAHHVTRMRPLDWSQVENVIEGMEVAIRVHPPLLKGLQERTSLQSGRHIPVCPLFKPLPSLSYKSKVCVWLHGNVGSNQ